MPIDWFDSFKKFQKVSESFRKFQNRNSQVDHVDDHRQVQQEQHPVLGEQKEDDQEQIGDALGQHPSIKLHAAFLAIDVVAL